MQLNNFDLGKFIGEEKGSYFRVEIYENYVVKYPHKNKTTDNRLVQIAKAQTYLSKHIRGILPCWKVGRRLVTPRVPGVRCDVFEHDEWRRLRRGLLMPIVRQAKSLGYDIGDKVADSCFYDGETLYFVDFHSVRGW